MIKSGVTYTVGKRGSAYGKLIVEFLGKVSPEDVLNNFEEVKSLLNEVKSKGFKYLFIESEGRYFIEIDFSGQQCSIYPLDDLRLSKNPRLAITIETMSEQIPEKVIIRELEKFKINISTEKINRAVSLDLAKGVILYVHEAFWDWNDGWVNDEEKLSQAKKICEIVRWLLEEKKFKLDEGLDIEHCNNLLRKFEKLKSNKEGMGH